MRQLSIAMIAAIAFVLAPRAAAGGVLVFAAASLQESLTAVADAYAAQGNERPTVSFAASSMLARQIENGAPAAIFVSADEQWMDYLAERKLLADGTRADLLGNRLVLVAPKSRPFQVTIGSGFALGDLLGGGKLAMADPESVPAGRYGKAALTSLGVWSKVEASVVRAADVRAALTLVERDEVRAGIVYATDARAAKNVVVAGEFPATSHPPIVYPTAIVAAHDTPAARRFRDFLRSDDAMTLFERQGFSRK